MKFDLVKAGTADPEGSAADVAAIVVRNRRFSREPVRSKWWLGNDPVATAWHTALSVAFPKGEAFFIDTIRAHRAGAPAKLDAEIRAFISQEANHTREHIAFNRMASEGGYNLAKIDARIDARIELINCRKPIENLAATVMLEHLTALLARQTLTNPDYMGDRAGDKGDLWRWHAIEEIAHKGVAFDTWLHATRDWSRWRRWRVKTAMGLIASTNFMLGRMRETFELLAQDGLTGLRWKWRVLAYLAWRPGVLRHTFADWLRFFLPGFHPWKEDDEDRALIALYDSEFPDAVLSRAEIAPN